MTDDGFERAVRENKDRVHGYAFYMLRDREESLDVAQETLVRLWKNRSSVPDEAARPWLLRTAHHLVVDRIRRHAIRSGPPVEEHLHSLKSPEPGPERSAASREAGRFIGEALAALSPRDRAIVLMREVQGMAYDEIAQALDLPLGTLKATLHRAREKLRRSLTEAGMVP